MRRLTRRLAAFCLTLSAALPAAAEAQGYRPGGSVPPGHAPPPGECRVWYPDRPPGQQPAPVDCRRAQYEAGRFGGRVIYGGPPADRRWDDDQRGRRGDRDRRWERDGDDDWVRVCVRRDWHGHCIRSELRRR